MSPADAAARLKEATLVLQSTDGKLVDPAYRALLNKKTLILVTTEANGPGVPPPTVRPGAERGPAARRLHPRRSRPRQKD